MTGKFGFTSEGSLDSDESDHEHATDPEQATEKPERRESDSFRQRSQIIKEDYNSVRRRSQLAADASSEADVFRRRSRLSVQPSQAEILQTVETRRNSVRLSTINAEKLAEAAATAQEPRRLSSKEKAGAAKERHRAVKGNSPYSSTGHRSARKKDQQASQNASNSFGKQMNQSARTMYDAVHSLYRSPPPGESGPRTKGGDARESSKEKATDGGRRQSLQVRDDPHEPLPRAYADSSASGATSDSHSSDSDVSKRKHHYGDGDDSSESAHSDGYDFRQAAMKVNDLLEALNSDARADILTDLNGWYVSRKAGVEEDLHDLNCVNTDHQHREEDIKMSMANMLQRFEEKQMREVKVLVNCHRTLNLGARGQLKRKRFAKSLSMKTPRSSPKASKSPKKSPKERLCETGLAVRGAARMSTLNMKKGSQKESAVSTSEKLESSADSPTEERALSDHSGSTPSDGHEDSNDEELDGDGEDSEENASLGVIEEGPDDLEGLDQQDKGLTDSNAKAAIEAGLDVEAARKKLKAMYDVPHSVMAKLNSEEPPAAEVLQALASVQEGHRQLELQAQLARKACEISKMALEYTMEGIPEKADGAVQELIEEVRLQVFGENGDCEAVGPDPEELEEECQALEALISKQEREMSALSKARERTMKLEQDMAEHLSFEHDSGDDDSQAPRDTLRMLESRDTLRAEGAQLLLGQRGNASQARGQMDPKAKAGASTSPPRGRNSRFKKSQTLDLGRGSVAYGAGDSANAEGGQAMQTLSSQAGQTVPSWQSNHQIQQLQAKIAEKETNIGKAREVQKRMKKELAVFRYCSQKAKLGLNAFEEEFDPSTIGGNSESSGSSSDSDKPSLQSGGSKKLTSQRSASQLLVPAQGRRSFSADTRPGQEGALQAAIVATVPIGDGDSSPTRRRNGTASGRTSRSVSRSSSKLVLPEVDLQSPVAQGGRGTMPMATVAGLHSSNSSRTLHSSNSNKNIHEEGAGPKVQTISHQKLETAEAQMKARIAELQVQIARDVFNLKSEKKRQAQLKKDIKRLKKNYSQMVGSHKSAPNSLEALDKTIKNLQDSGGKLRGQITELTDELTRQQRILEKAQAEAAADDEKRKDSKEDPKDKEEDRLLKRSKSKEDPTGRSASKERAASKGTAANATVTAAGSAAPLGSGGATASLLAGLAPAPKAGASPAGTAAGAAGAAGTTNAFGMPAAASATGEKKHSLAGEKKPSLAKSEAPKTEEARVGGPQGIRHEDLTELVRMQSCNEDYRKEIESLVQKMRQLRLTMMKNKNVISAEVIRDIVGSSVNPEDAKPPPEYWHLRKEVRNRQNEVRVLRKRWWTDHKDLDVFVEKVRHTHGIHEPGGHHGHYSSHGSHGQSAADAEDLRPDMAPLRRKLAEAQHEYNQRSSLLQQEFLPEQPRHHEADSEGSPKHHAGHIQRSKTQPLALGSLAAYRSTQSNTKNKFRFTLDMSSSNQEPAETLAPPTGITGKTIAASSSKPDIGGELSAIRRRYSTVRKSVLPGNAHTLKDLIKTHD